MRDRIAHLVDGRTVAVRDLSLAELHGLLAVCEAGLGEYEGDPTPQALRERLLIELCARVKAAAVGLGLRGARR